MVTGAITATCFHDSVDLNAALIATSVFQNQTSQTTNLSIGIFHSISFFTSQIACICPGVSSYGNVFSKSL
jgi:hypothetical protein